MKESWSERRDFFCSVVAGLLTTSWGALSSTATICTLTYSNEQRDECMRNIDVKVTIDDKMQNLTNNIPKPKYETLWSI